MTISHARMAVATCATALMVVAQPGIASAAQPQEGKYTDVAELGLENKVKIVFTVTRKPGKPAFVRGFKATRDICGSEDKVVVLVPDAMKVKPNGKFSFDGDVEEGDLAGQYVYVYGKFTSGTKAKGRVGFEACPLAEVEFVATKN